MTGLSARQLQWWDSRRLFTPAVASHRTEAGGYTERRYTPLDVLELQALADLRGRGFSIPRLRHLLDTLRDVFRVRLYEAIGDGGPMTLFVSGDQIFARMQDGRLFNLEDPSQPLLMVGEDLPIVGPSSSMPSVFYATGHFRNGVLLAPLTSSLVADLVMDGHEGPGMEMMRPARVGL